MVRHKSRQSAESSIRATGGPLKALKAAIVVSTLAATTVALAQTVTPQKPADQPRAPQTSGNASGGQTAGAEKGVLAGGGPGIAGLGTLATVAIVAGAVVVVA